MKILWHSYGPWANTSYGTQTALAAPRLRDAGFDVALSAFGLVGGPLDWDGIRAYPGGVHEGDSWEIPINAHLHFAGKPGLIVVLGGSHPLDPTMRSFDAATYVTVDHDPLSPVIGENLKITGSTPIAITRVGMARLEEAGFEPVYAPHGVDTHVFRPRNRPVARKLLGLPQEAFIVGSVAQNKLAPFKSLPERFAAFARFREKHEDALLLAHTQRVGGVNLTELAADLGISESVIFADQVRLVAGLYGAEDMSLLFASMNVLLGTSRNEGFGLPLLEAQACGVPVIVTDFGAMAEVGAVGWKVGGSPIFDQQAQSWNVLPNVEEIALALEEAYTGADALAEAARAHALQYDIDVVTSEYLVPALKSIAERCREEREVRATLQRLEADRQGRLDRAAGRASAVTA